MYLFGVFCMLYCIPLNSCWRVLQEVWLDRVTDRVCMSISAKGMAITGIDDRRYWNWIPTEESRLDLRNLS